MVDARILRVRVYVGIAQVAVKKIYVEKWSKRTLKIIVEKVNDEKIVGN